MNLSVFLFLYSCILYVYDERCKMNFPVRDNKVLLQYIVLCCIVIFPQGRADIPNSMETVCSNNGALTSTWLLKRTVNKDVLTKETHLSRLVRLGIINVSYGALCHSGGNIKPPCERTRFGIPC